MSFTRRQILRSAATVSGAAALPALGAFGTPGAQATPTLPALGPVPSRGAFVILLGTAAGPVPMDGRTGIATALVVDGRVYLIDMGHGSFDQFQKSGLEIADVDRIFVTHLHSDHLADLYSLLWLRFGGVDSMTHVIDIHGPGPAGALPRSSTGKTVATVSPSNPTPGLADYFANSIAATAYDINIRMRDEGWPDIRDLFRVHEIALPDVGADPTGSLAPPMKPFVVHSDDRVSVTAILVQHPPVFPSFAFRFDTDYGSVVFSGDTTITPNMITLSKKADILVHEAIDLTAVQTFGNLNQSQLQHHRESHSDVRLIGSRVAQPAGVKTLVLSHLAPGTKALPDLTWKAQASLGFSGQVIVGNDLQRIALTR